MEAKIFAFLVIIHHRAAVHRSLDLDREGYNATRYLICLRIGFDWLDNSAQFVKMMTDTSVMWPERRVG